MCALNDHYSSLLCFRFFIERVNQAVKEIDSLILL
jgi:hypothetical protein